MGSPHRARLDQAHRFRDMPARLRERSVRWQGHWICRDWPVALGYLDLEAQEIQGAQPAGTGSVDGVPVTIYKLSQSGLEDPDISGLTSEQVQTIRAANAIIQSSGFGGKTTWVSVDTEGYIREQKTVYTLPDGSTVTADTVLSNFGCAGTVLMPGQQGSSAPPVRMRQSRPCQQRGAPSRPLRPTPPIRRARPQRRPARPPPLGHFRGSSRPPDGLGGWSQRQPLHRRPDPQPDTGTSARRHLRGGGRHWASGLRRRRRSRYQGGARSTRRDGLCSRWDPLLRRRGKPASAGRLSKRHHHDGGRQR